MYMEENNLPIEKINKFLESYSFEVEDPINFGDTPGINFIANVKIQLIGIKDYISTGDKKPHFEYELYIVPGDKKMDEVLKMFYPPNTVTDVNTYDRTIYLSLIYKMSVLLQNVLKYFNYHGGVICKKVINELL